MSSDLTVTSISTSHVCSPSICTRSSRIKSSTNQQFSSINSDIILSINTQILLNYTHFQDA